MPFSSLTAKKHSWWGNRWWSSRSLESATVPVTVMYLLVKTGYPVGCKAISPVHGRYKSLLLQKWPSNWFMLVSVSKHAKSHENFEVRIYLIEGGISPCLSSNMIIGQEKGLFGIWTGILEDACIPAPQNPYCVCIQSEFRLLQLTNSASNSSSNRGLFLRNTVNLLLQPALTVSHGCGGCWQERVCHTRHKDNGHSPHHH